MTDLIRDAIDRAVDVLDAKEAANAAAKAVTKRGRPAVPKLVQHADGKRPTLAIEMELRKDRKTALANVGLGPKLFDFPIEVKEDVPQKLRKSFRRWAEYLEAAKDKADHREREREIVEDIRDRTSDVSEIKRTLEAFQEFMQERAESKRTEEGTLDDGALEIVGGDVD